MSNISVTHSPSPFGRNPRRATWARFPQGVGLALVWVWNPDQKGGFSTEHCLVIEGGPRAIREPYYPDLLPHKRPLWREFAALPKTAEQFAEFVRTYGPLRNPEVLEGPDGTAFELADSPTRTVYAERVSIWEKHVTALQTVQSLLDAVREGDRKYLERTLQGNKYGLYDMDPEAALTLVQKLVNAGLQENAAPRLLFQARHPRSSEWDPAPRDLGLYLVPDTLLGYIYMTCAEEISGQTSPAHCKVCGQLFLATDERDMYCCDAHKQKAWRERKKAASKVG